MPHDEVNWKSVRNWLWSQRRLIKGQYSILEWALLIKVYDASLTHPKQAIQLANQKFWCYSFRFSMTPFIWFPIHHNIVKCRYYQGHNCVRVMRYVIRFDYSKARCKVLVKKLWGLCYHCRQTLIIIVNHCKKPQLQQWQQKAHTFYGLTPALSHYHNPIL